MLDVWQFHNEKAKNCGDENEAGKLPHWTFSIPAEVPMGSRGLVMIRSSAVCALIFVALTVAGSAAAQPRIQAGILQCRGAPTASFIVGSVHQAGCVFQLDRGPRYRYYGFVRRVGLDIGFTEQSTLAWAVLAPTDRIGPGDVSGNYGGLTAAGAIGTGANASALVGGSNNELSLQPLSFDGQTGLNVALGIAGLELHYASGILAKKRSTSQQVEKEALFQQFLKCLENKPVDNDPRQR